TGTEMSVARENRKPGEQRFERVAATRAKWDCLFRRVDSKGVANKNCHSFLRLPAFYAPQFLYKMQLPAGFRSQIGSAMRSPKFVWSGLLFLLAVITATVADARSAKPQAALPDDANQLVREAVHNELNGEGKDHTHWRYHLHREDERGSQDREVID